MPNPSQSNTRIEALYLVRGTARDIEARARAIAVEQSVEMPVAAIEDQNVLTNIVGAVRSIEDCGEGQYRVRIGLAAATTGFVAGQLFNMLLGNTSMFDDVTLLDAVFPDDLISAFGGPRQSLAGWRARCGATIRAMTCGALKPQGLPVDGLARLAKGFAQGGIDFLKDDHGLADQHYSPFATRIPACASALREVGKTSGRTCVYVPSLSGNLDELRAQIRLTREEGLSAVLVAPMVVGVSSFHTLVSENPDIAFMAHPSMAGAQRFAAPFLLGKLFRLLGADATIFPNHGGRFTYSKDLCAGIAHAARAPWSGVKASAPVPAGGMTLDRVPEMLEFYGADTILLIGGGLLSAGAKLPEATAAFQRMVESYSAARKA